MENKIVIANWKMNHLDDQGWALWKQISQDVHLEEESTLPDICICPSFLGLAKISEKKKETIAASNLFLGAQDVSKWQDGAFTGEVSAQMLKECGCHYVIIGHSERRNLFGEDNVTVKEKALRLKEQGLTIVLCIGENSNEKEAGLTYSTLSTQIEGAFGEINQWGDAKIIIAYEPVWSIGTGNVPDNLYIQDVIEHIATYANLLIGKNISVLYGGSVNENNVRSLRKVQGIGGLLVGGASLSREQFIGIVKSFKNQ